MSRSRLALLAACLIATGALACERDPPPTPEGCARAAEELHRAHEYGKAIELYRRSLELRADPLVQANLARPEWKIEVVVTAAMWIE